ncbi:MAG: WD40 repeat domain-containing protein [Planctomycetota bacterium]
MRRTLAVLGNCFVVLLFVARSAAVPAGPPDGEVGLLAEKPSGANSSNAGADRGEHISGRENRTVNGAIFPVSSRRTIQVPPDISRTHSAVITSVSIHPDGTLVAAAGDDHVIRLWDLKKETWVARLTGHQDWIRAVQFSPDGKTLVSSGNDRHVIMWDVATERAKRTLAVRDQAMNAITFSHSGRWVATAGFGGEICILDTTGEASRRFLETDCRDIRTLAISDDDLYLAAGGRDGIIRLWNLETRQVTHQVNSHQQRIRAMTFAQDGTRIISGGEDGMVRIWNWKTDKQSVELPRLPCKVMALVTCGRQILATAGSDNMVRLWNLATREELARMSEHTGSVVALDYRDGTLVSGGFDTSLRVWTVPTSLDEGIRSAHRPE